MTLVYLCVISIICISCRCPSMYSGVRLNARNERSVQRMLTKREGVAPPQPPSYSGQLFCLRSPSHPQGLTRMLRPALSTVLNTQRLERRSRVQFPRPLLSARASPAGAGFPAWKFGVRPHFHISSRSCRLSHDTHALGS